MAHPVIAPSRSVNIFMLLLPPIVASKKLHYQSHKQIRGPNEKTENESGESGSCIYVSTYMWTDNQGSSGGSH